MTADAIIQTAGLRRTFKGRGGEVEAVAGVDLSVAAGDIFGFLGPNGAGKTTTLRILATLLSLTAGTARVAGFDVARQPREVRTRIGYVAQSGGSYRESTGREELVIQGRLFGMTKAEAGARAVEILAALDLLDAADRTCKTYSGGMRRRLNIGIGMVHRPAVLFLDEPTTGLDPHARARLWEEIRKLRETGTTVFLTTHYLEEADALCDRLAIIDHGRIVAEGTPDELKHEIAPCGTRRRSRSAAGQPASASRLLRVAPEDAPQARRPARSAAWRSALCRAKPIPRLLRQLHPHYRRRPASRRSRRSRIPRRSRRRRGTWRAAQ
jgi:ABC-2 type transport system ATP-binding protein